MKKIAVYGKGGIGKSTTVSNLSAAISRLQGGALRVMQIGCDPKADSTVSLAGTARLPTVLDTLRRNPSPALFDLVGVGYNGIFCVEAGGPTPGTGCAGRGIVAAFEKLQELAAFEECAPDIVLYDVLGDVVCGGFAMPMRDGYADEVVIVTSGEAMALYAARAIAQAVRSFAGRNYASLGGIILNRRNVAGEQALVEEFAREAGAPVIGDVPRSPLVQQAESLGKTVCEAFPQSDLAQTYEAIARRLVAGTGGEAASGVAR